MSLSQRLFLTRMDSLGSFKITGQAIQFQATAPLELIDFILKLVFGLGGR